MSKRLLFERLDEQAVEIHKLRQQIADAFAAHNRANTQYQALGKERDALQARINALVAESRDLTLRLARVEDQRLRSNVRGVLADALAICERSDLGDNDKWRSVRGLIQQANIAPARTPAPKRETDSTTPRTRRTRTKPQPKPDARIDDDGDASAAGLADPSPSSDAPSQ